MFKFTTRVINLFKKFGVWLPVVLTAYCMVRLVSVLFDPRNPKEEIHSKKTKYINFFWRPDSDLPEDLRNEVHLQAVNSIALASAYVPSKRFAIFFEKILPAEVNFSFARASRLAQLGKNKLGHLEGSSLAARRLLSVGCRDDLELVMLRRIFPTFRVIGLDISAPSEDIVAGDMHSMPFENGQFSVVFSSHSLEHSYQPEKAMSEMVRVCSRPGLLVIEVPISDPSGTTPTKLDKGADRWDFHNDKTIFSLLPPEAKPKLIVTEITSNIDAIRCIILLEV